LKVGRFNRDQAQVVKTGFCSNSKRILGSYCFA